jgi:peptidoglycan/LPS O-acetylase OafA/YrhL
MHPPQTNCVPVSEGLGYLPQLDALRAFAVLLVVWHHWFGPRELGLGPMGVWIFFVISGFLITRILLNSKGATARGNRSALVRFYVRRFLRIFPLYYFVLLVALFTSAAFPCRTS